MSDCQRCGANDSYETVAVVQIVGLNIRFCFGCANDHLMQSNAQFGKRFTAINATEQWLDSQKACHQIVERVQYLAYHQERDQLHREMRAFALEFVEAGAKEKDDE